MAHAPYVIYRDALFCVNTASRMSLLEQLTLQLPDVTVHAWKIDDEVSREKLRDVLLNVRQVALTRIVIMMSPGLINRVLEQVFNFEPNQHIFTFSI